MKKQFNVLEFDFNKKQVVPYDVLPYFREQYKEGFLDAKKKTTLKDFKEWVERLSKYQFWARCEYECVIGPWPFKENNLENEIKKVDVHQQIILNIDLITEILFNELVKKEK